MIPLLLVAGVRWIGERFSGSPTDSLSRHLLLKPGYLEKKYATLLTQERGHYGAFLFEEGHISKIFLNLLSPTTGRL